MKQRTPGSFAAAITRIKTGLGEQVCADVVGKTTSTIRKWSDPDQGSFPTIREALTLDVAYVKAGLGEPPILAAYGSQLPRRLLRQSEAEIDLLKAALSVQVAVGDLSETISEAIDPSSPGGVELTVMECNMILEILEKLRRTIDRIVGALTAGLDSDEIQ